MLQTSRSRVRFPMVSLKFFSEIILPVALWPWGQLSLQQIWVPGVIPGGKGGWCVRLTTLPPSCAVVMKSGNLNFLEPSVPLQACNGTALPFYVLLVIFTAGNMCKICGFDKDNQRHIITGWVILVSTEYKTSQYKLATHIPQEIC